MKLVKSLLLGSAAGFAVVAGAQAADLPIRKAEPVAVEYVRVCSAYGASFFYIPGTETCLRVGGRVRAEYRYLEPFDRSDDTIGFRARGRLNIDARTPTAYGTLRAYIRYEITRNTGVYNFPVAGAAVNSPDMTQAFVQFGGLTAGRITSFFTNADIATQHFGTLRFDDTPDIPALAYTFSFGGGFSASVALEDNISRRNTGLPVGLLGTAFGFPSFGGNVFPGFNFPFTSYAPAGDTAPDFVANIKYVGTWGNAQLSGAVHQIRDLGVPAAFTAAGAPILGTPRLFNDTEYGWAISPSVQVNLPFFAAGDYFWVVGTYSQGAPNYAGFTGSNIGFGGDVTTIGLTDATINAFTGNLEKTDVWSIAADFTHFWTPALRSSIFGSYANVQFGSGSSTVLTAATAPGFAGLTVGFTDFNEIRIGGNTIWSPVAGLNLGLEVMYTRVDFDHRVPAVETGALATVVRPGGRSDVDVWEGRVRVQRDF
jgi:porin-like protein